MHTCEREKGMTMVDPLVAEVVAHLTPGARRRLDGYIRGGLQDQGLARLGFKAVSAEIPDIGGVQALTAQIRRGKAILRIQFQGSVAWEEQRLILWRQMPDTLISAMRGRALRTVVDHPLFDGATVSSARRHDGSVVIETKRRAPVDLSSVASTGVTSPLELIGTLSALGVAQVCKVASNIICAMQPPAIQAMLDRLASTPESAVLTDLVSWLPSGVESMTVGVKDGVLGCRADLTAGSFSTGRLNLHGGSRSRSKILGGWVFAPYKCMGPSYQPRTPRQPTIPLQEFTVKFHENRIRHIAA